MATVVAAVDDFFFASKLREAARQIGVELAFPADLQGVVEAVVSSGARLVLLDLNGDTYSRLDAVRALKADARTRGALTVGYLSHVMTDLKKAAEASGCDRVMARSAFVKELPRLLREASGAP
jgi:CheY-like chemotaxis protein